MLETTTEILGAGLASPDLAVGRESVTSSLNAVYSSILQSRLQNWGMWEAVRAHVVGTIRAKYRADGLEAAPMWEDAFWARIDKPLPDSNPLRHVSLVAALLTPYNERFCRHIRYRLEHAGNVHFEFSGPTGSGKSSCAIAVADWMRQIDAARLPSHLSFDIADLTARFRGKERGDTVILDEYLQTAGEGARTAQGQFANLEDTLRASGVSLFVCSPRRHEYATMQAQLEAVLWNPAKAFTRFLVWIEGEPRGVVDLPWARKPLFDVYQVWKDQNVSRTRSGHFRDRAQRVKSAMRAFEDDNLVDYLVNSSNKPKKTDFHAAVDFFHPEMLSVSQVDGVVSFMYNVCYNYERLAPKLKRMFDVEPTPGLQKVARKCYGE